MNARRGNLAVSVLTLAVQAALAAMAVTPTMVMADEATDALTRPTN